MIEKILDLPVIIQGALGSFLFWLTYEVVKRILSKISFFIGKYNNNWKREALIFEQMQANLFLCEKEQMAQHLLICIYGGLSRAIQGIIYLCFGLISSNFLGEISIIAYAFSIVYFFRALKAVFLEVSSGKDTEYYKKRVEEIEEELAKLESRA